MEKSIETRISELKKEIADHEKDLNDLRRAMNEATTRIISKSGAVMELTKLIEMPHE